MVLFSASSDRTGERRGHVGRRGTVWRPAGWSLARVGPSPAIALAGLCIAQLGMMSMLPMFWALPTAFLSGAAAAGGIALINSVANIGGFLGPMILGQFGLWAMAVTLLAGAALVMCVRARPAWREVGSPSLSPATQRLIAATIWRPTFRRGDWCRIAIVYHAATAGNQSWIRSNPSRRQQKQGWAFFAPLETFTTPVAAQLVKHARVQPGQRVLDAGCGTGVVAVTAARRGAQVTGLDLTPALLERARENAEIAGLSIDWHEGDIEALPFGDGAFDVVLSQFGHMFAPRPEVAIAQMLRVLKPGGTIAFATWPPELFTGRMFAITARYAPAPPPGAAPPPQWGDPNVVVARLGDNVKDILFDRGTMRAPALSPQHFRTMFEKTAGPLIKVVENLAATDPQKLAAFRAEYEALIGEYLEDNTVRQDYLLTRAVKA